MRPFFSQNKKPRVRSNEHIRVPEIRLIGSAGEQLGIVPTKDGLQRAQDEGLDLVEIAPNVSPPVCKIMDFGKHIYDLGKKEKESRKKQKFIDMKEVKMGLKIDDHDYQTKLRNARRFLERGDKVKLTTYFRGREITHAEIGKRLVERFINDLTDVALVERNAGLEGRSIQVYFSPAQMGKKPPKEKKGKGTKDAEVKDEQSS